MVFKHYQGADYDNILITYNLINVNSQDFKKGDIFPMLEQWFSETITLERNDDVSIWNLRAFNKYYCKKIEEYRPLVERLASFSHLYFFSDLEKPIEIMVGMLKEKNPIADICIIDEGIASYYRQRPHWKDVAKGVVSLVFHYKYINHTANYGGSRLYSRALASYPDKCVFKCGRIDKMQPMSPKLLNEVTKSNVMGIDMNHKYILYLSSILDISFGISREREMEVLLNLKKIANEKGYPFYVKPHPVQDENYYSTFESYGSNVIKEALPAEMFFSENAVIVSVVSSALINAGLQGIKAIDLSLIFDVDAKVPITLGLKPSSLKDFEKMIN